MPIAAYSVALATDPDGRTVARLPDFPGMVVTGRDESEALAAAERAVLLALKAAMRAASGGVPMPAAAAAWRHRIVLSLGTRMKLQLWREMRARGVRKAELARGLGLHPPQIERLLDPAHSSRIEQIEAAFAALGLALEVTTTPTDAPP